MCGITAAWFRESVPNPVDLLEFWKRAEDRGSDGFGLTRFLPHGNSTYKYPGTPDYSLMLDDIRLRGQSNFQIGEVIITNHRAAPETESEVSADEIYKTLQPIVRDDVGLVHNGAVSNFIVRELKEKYEFETYIDSEAIICAYLEKQKNIQETLEYLSGGFACVMVDQVMKRMYLFCSHNPLYVGYVRGVGLFAHSFEDAIWKMISRIKGTNNINLKSNGECVWEDYYVHQVPGNTIISIDLDSGMMRNIKFTPRYVHPKWDPYKVRNVERKRQAVFVSASGGLDSTTTLATLKEAGMNPIAVHFLYGHRGQVCERAAIQHVTDVLGVPLVEFDLRDTMSKIDTFSMLTNPDHEITTGTAEGIKTLAAWTVFRNGFFVTHMGAMAESMILQNEIDEAYITGGFMNLTESGIYPDNSERFIQSYIRFTETASLVGGRIKPLFGLCNILKTEQYHILNQLGYLDKLGPWLISCDRPQMIPEGMHQVPANCQIFNNETGQYEPACGSGRLSWWAVKMAGLKDNRRYYTVNDPGYKPYSPPTKFQQKFFNWTKLINKLEIPDENKEIFKKRIISSLEPISIQDK